MLRTPLAGRKGSCSVIPGELIGELPYTFCRYGKCNPLIIYSKGNAAERQMVLPLPDRASSEIPDDAPVESIV